MKGLFGLCKSNVKKFADYRRGGLSLNNLCKKINPLYPQFANVIDLEPEMPQEEII